MTPAPKIEIYYSHLRMLSLFTGAVGFVVLGFFLARGAFGAGGGSFKEFIGYAAMLFFGAVSIFILRQWFFSSVPVVTLTDTGVTDIRIASEEIPWRAVNNLAMWQQGRQRSLVLSVDPDVEAGLRLTRIARWTREPNKALGVDGLCLRATGLRIKFVPLAEQVAERFGANRPGESGE